MHSPPSDPFYTLTQGGGEIDPIQGALLIARDDAYPDLDIECYMHRLDQLASDCRDAGGDLSAPPESLERLNVFLFAKMGFRGNREDYYDPRNSYLNDVLDRRLGIPITLSLVYLAIGNRLDLPLAGINFPGHFLVRCTGLPEPLFVDPFAGGQVLGLEDLQQLLPVVGGQRLELQAQFLEPAPARDILVRMLRNLKQIHTRRRAFRKAVNAGEKIVCLSPGEAQDHRDLGYLYYWVHEYRRSLEAFEEYLRRETDPPDEAEIRQNIQVISARLAMLN